MCLPLWGTFTTIWPAGELAQERGEVLRVDLPADVHGVGDRLPLRVVARNEVGQRLLVRGVLRDAEDLLAEELPLPHLQDHHHQLLGARRQGDVVPVLLGELHDALLDG